MDASLDIIIVNWNSGHHLHQCLESIADCSQSGWELCRVVVIDNASTDSSLEGLKILNLPLVLTLNPVNRGFAAACNQGSRGSRAHFLLFLNPDTRLCPQSPGQAIAFMRRQENDRVGILGIQLLNEKGEISCSCAHFPTFGHFLGKMLGLDRLFPAVFRPRYVAEHDLGNNQIVDQVMGAFFLIRRSLFETLGGFDERFFLYFEEVDLSYRALLNGWMSYYLADARAYHIGWGSSSQVKGERLYHSLRSRILYGYKHFSWPMATLLFLSTLIVEPIARVGHSLAQGSFQDVVDTFQGFLKFWWEAPRLFISGFQRS
jgi:N-acetylglucosaminyl-diphospho-decaprenol L-rhamnosyltransferase